jgi:hypothetical protein
VWLAFSLGRGRSVPVTGIELLEARVVFVGGLKDAWQETLPKHYGQVQVDSGLLDLCTAMQNVVCNHADAVDYDYSQLKRSIAFAYDCQFSGDHFENLLLRIAIGVVGCDSIQVRQYAASALHACCTCPARLLRINSVRGLTRPHAIPRRQWSRRTRSRGDWRWAHSPAFLLIPPALPKGVAEGRNVHRVPDRAARTVGVGSHPVHRSRP